jgi:8-amino-7-oxononanoate synthase
MHASDGFEDLADQLSERKQRHLYRSRSVVGSPQGVETVIDGQKFLCFCSNDYLGLANHPDLIAGFKQAADEFGVGAGSAHLINGHSHYHHELELALADFTGRERALLFSTGYMANLGAVCALTGRKDAVFEDRLNHASLLDAGLLSGARFKRYRHAEVSHLAQQMGTTKGQRKLVLTDGVFSMDGDIAPLAALAKAAVAEGAWLMVDDAHGFGCIGNKGRGSVDACQLSQTEVPVLMATLGKAFGTAGAFVAGSESMIETLIQHARTYIYTTAMPPAIAAATLVSLKRVQTDDWRRDKLAALVQQFRNGAEQLGFEIMASETPIQPIIVNTAERALNLSNALKQQGVLVTAIRPPTVPGGSARLRITFSANHTQYHVERLLEALDVAFKQVDRHS